MLVDDRTELQHENAVAIGTSRYRLSLELCGCALKTTRGVAVCIVKNLFRSWSKGSQKKPYLPWIGFIMHYLCLGGDALC